MAAQRVVVPRPVVALAALVGLLPGVLPHVHLHHGLPRRLQGHDSIETKNGLSYGNGLKKMLEYWLEIVKSNKFKVNFSKFRQISS